MLHDCPPQSRATAEDATLPPAAATPKTQGSNRLSPAYRGSETSRSLSGSNNVRFFAAWQRSYSSVRRSSELVTTT